MAYKSLLIMGFMALGACANVPAPISAALGSDPSVDGGSYSSGGGLAFASSLVQVDGRAALCGVRTEMGRQSVLTKGKANQVASSGSAYVDGQLLHRSLTFMRKVAPQESFAGMEGTCVLTSRAWQSGDATRKVELRIPQQVVYRDGSDLLGTGPIITFRQTGPQSTDNLLRRAVSSGL